MNFEDEIWKKVPSVPGMLASSYGRVMAETREGDMPNGGKRLYQGKPWFGSWAGKRYTVMFHKKTYRVARLVCEAFHGDPPSSKSVAMHKDENARNNISSNLEWGTQKQNLNFPGFIKYCKGRTGKSNPHIKGKRAKARILA